MFCVCADLFLCSVRVNDSSVLQSQLSHKNFSYLPTILAKYNIEYVAGMVSMSSRRALHVRTRLDSETSQQESGDEQWPETLTLIALIRELTVLNFYNNNNNNKTSRVASERSKPIVTLILTAK